MKEEKVKLSDYKESKPIFIDANIFIDYSLPNPKYGGAVADFLEKLELLEVKAVTSPVVLDEVSYIILMHKGSLLLKNQDRQVIRDSIKRDRNISNLCYDVIEEFNEFLDSLKGLQIFPVTKDDYKQASILGQNYCLLPSDALHASVMKNNNIFNICNICNTGRRF